MPLRAGGLASQIYPEPDPAGMSRPLCFLFLLPDSLPGRAVFFFRYIYALYS